MKKIISFFLITVICLSLASCALPLKSCNLDDFLKNPEPPFVCDSHRDADDDGRCDYCSESFDDGGEVQNTDPSVDIEPDLDPDAPSGSAKIYTAAVSLYKGNQADLSSLLSEYITLEGATWESDSETVAAVSDGVVVANAYGRTTVRVTDIQGNRCDITLTVKVYVNQSGFSITPTSDDTVYPVSSERMANELIDRAISAHKNHVILDFSSLGGSYMPFSDFDFKFEYGNHVSITKKYYEGKPQILYVEFTYNENAASTYTESTPSTTYASVDNANMLLRNLARKNSAYKRPDGFSDFPIYTENAGTMNVRNSEELWWALEHNYLPVFPTKYTKAESFFEQAKIILREIITDDMTEYEKLLAIFDYLVNEIGYDYAAAERSDNPIGDVCYYLEGVFERGLAVCDGKSKAFVLFCAIEGIECLRDFGSPKGGSAGHAWNYVRLDGKWYLVDTTNADMAQTESVSIGNFLGKNVELTSYETFLTTLDYHSDKYEYSGIHSDVFSNAGANRALSFLDAAPKGRCYDFRVASNIEYKSMLADIFSLGVDECVLTVHLTRFIADKWNIPIDEVMSQLGVKYDYAAFTTTVGATEINYIVFKRK